MLVSTAGTPATPGTPKNSRRETNEPVRTTFSFRVRHRRNVYRLVLLDEVTGELHTYKTLTTPENPGEAVIEGWDVLLKRADAQGSSVRLCIHGTTLITNTFIQRNGARTALLTTAGFSDIARYPARDALRYL